MRNTLALALVMVGALSAAAREKVEVRSSETVPFEAGGRIQLDHSFGAVEVEGWDRPEVEVTVIRAAKENGRTRENLERIRIRLVRPSHGRLRIETEFPNRTLARPFRGKSNLDLRYQIKAPADTALSISHDVGEVVVRGLRADMEISNRIGEVSVKLPEGASYRADARVKLGEVSSELSGRSRRRFLSGEFTSSGGQDAHRLYLRVGIGEIQIRRAGGKEDRREPRII